MLLHAFLFCALFTLILSPYELARADNQDKMVENLVKLRNKPAKEVLSEANAISKVVEDEKEIRKNNLLETMKQMDKSSLKNLGIILVVFSMTPLSGITVITTFLVDIFSSTGISEIVLVLVTGLSEMGFSFFQMLIADRLDRLMLNSFLKMS